MISAEEAKKLSYTAQEQRLAAADLVLDAAIRKAIKLGQVKATIQENLDILIEMQNLATKAGYETLLRREHQQFDKPSLIIKW